MISFLKTINMKRFLVSCVIYALFACNILAQTQMNRSYLYNRGYKANIQASVLFANNSELSSISSSHGYSFGNGLYLGGGTGIVYSPIHKLNVKNQIIIYCCPLKVSEQRDIHPQCCCNGIADDFSEGKPLS